MKIVVIGANGFLGKLVVSNLQEHGHDVISVTRQTVNITNFNDVKTFLYKIQPYAIVNCAIPGGRNKIDNLDQTDVNTHVTTFLNFFNLSHCFEKYVNIGSGAEFDRAQNISNIDESEILTRLPSDNYGYMKNTISRISSGNPKFHTLRIFGCFDSSESEDRLFPKLFNNTLTTLTDREFDFISVNDFCIILNYYLNNTVIYRDINCVYKDKKYISDVLYEFIAQYNIRSTLSIDTVSNNNYTGNSSRLDLLNLPLDGLMKSIENYK